MRDASLTHLGRASNPDGCINKSPLSSKLLTSFSVALYGRDFVHAKVFVNLSETETYTLEIGGIAYTLNPKSGLIVSS